MNPLVSPLILLVGGGLVALGLRLPRNGRRGLGIAIAIVGVFIAAYGALGVLLLGL